MLQVEGHKETAHNPKQARHLPIINPNKHNFPIKSYEQYSSNEITNFHSLEHSASSVFHQGSKLCRNQSEASLVSNAPSTFMPSKYYEYEAQFQQSNESAESKGRKGTRVNFSIRKSAADCSKSNNFKPKEPMPSVLKAVSLKRSNSDMVKTRVERPSLQFSNFETVRHNPHPGKTEVYTSEESSKPAFILGSSAQVTKASKNSCQDWKTLNELPSVYTLSEQTSKVSFTKSIMSNKTEQELRSNWSKDSFKTASDFYKTANADEDLLRISIDENIGVVIGTKMLEPNEKDITFLTSVNNQNTHQLDSNQEAKSEPIYHEGTETENTFKSSIQHSFLLKPMTKDSDGRAQKWYGVPQKVRFLINDNYVQSLKPCNFYEEHKELLPVFPAKKIKNPKLLLRGKTVEPSHETKEIIKDSDHILRVLSREGTPWVKYKLRPTNKIKQDPFCTNYGELLKLDVAKNPSLNSNYITKCLGDFFRIADHNEIFSDGVSDSSSGLSRR